jgi:hypothetical protein
MTSMAAYGRLRAQRGGLVALGALAILLVCVLALPGRAAAFAVYNDTNVDAGNSSITYSGTTVHAQAHRPGLNPSRSDFEKDIAPGDNEGCSYKVEDCGNGDRDKAFRLTVTVGGDIRFACDVAMKAGGFVSVRVRRRTYQPSMSSERLEYYCDSRYDHDGTEDQIDVEPHFIGQIERNIGFTVTGDPQYDNGDGEGSTAWNNADATLNAMRGFFNNPTVRGALVAGDLTQWSRPIDEWKAYRSAIADLKPGDDHAAIRPGVAGSTTYWDDYPQGLGRNFFDTAGNHDGSYPDSSGDPNYTACETALKTCQDPDAIYREINERYRSTVLTKRDGGGYKNDPPQNQPPGLYSWDWNDIHFVSLGVMGADERSSQDIDISHQDRCQLNFDSTKFTYCGDTDFAGPDPGKALDFLKDDLAENVGTSGRPVIVMQHYGFDDFSLGKQCGQATDDDGDNIADTCRYQVWWTPSQQLAEWNALASYNVAAMFTGHLHLNPTDAFEQTWTKPTGATGGPASIRTYIAGGAMNKAFLFARITDRPSADDTDCNPTALQTCLEIYRFTATGGTGWTQSVDSSGARLVSMHAISAPPAKVVPTVRLTGPATATITFVDEYTASVFGTAPRGGTATGTVTFTSDGTQIPGCVDVALDNLEARCRPSFSDATSLAVHHIVAHYNGNDFFDVADSNTVDTALGGAATNVIFLTNPNFQSGKPTDLTVSVAAAGSIPAVGGTVSLQQEDLGDLSPLPQGQCPDAVPVVGGKAVCHATFSSDTRLPIRIRATYSGNTVFGGAWSVEDTFVLPATHTTVTSSRNPVPLGEKVSYTATVTAAAGVDQPTGLVDFLDSDGNALEDDLGNPVCVQVQTVNGKAVCPDIHIRHVADGGTITASYGTQNVPNLSDSTGAVVQVVTKGASTTTLSSFPSPAVTGQEVTVVATVAPTAPASVGPDGTVDFSTGGMPITACTDVEVTHLGSAYGAQCKLTLTASASTVTAVYSGSFDLKTSTGAKTVAVNKAPTETSVFRQSVTPPETGQTTAISAGVGVPPPGAGTPTGKIRFSVGGTTISGCEEVAIRAATNTAICNAAFKASQSPVTVTATYLGDGDFAQSTSDGLSFSVEKGFTTLGLSSSDTSLVSGQEATLTATVSAPPPGGGTPGGAVKFYAGSTEIAGCESVTLSGGVATCTKRFRASGWPGYVAAVYAGDADYENARDNQDVSVSKAATTTALTATPTAAVSGQDVTYHATVAITAPGSGTATETVEFSDGTDVVSGCGAIPVASDGSADCTTRHRVAAQPRVTAAYSGDGELTGSTSGTVSVPISKATTATGLASSDATAVVGQPITYTAKPVVWTPGSGTPTGKVTFRDGTSPIAGCTDVALGGGAAACTTVYTSTAGSPHSITAAYGGDDELKDSTSDPVPESVDKAVSTTTLTSSPNPSVTAQGVTLTAAVAVDAPGAASSGGTVAFADGTSTLAGCGAVPVGADGKATCSAAFNAASSPHELRAGYSGNASLKGSSGAQTQTVNRAPSALTPAVVREGLFKSTFTATLQRATDGTPLAGRTITFYLGNVPKCSAVTNASGVGSCQNSGWMIVTGVYTYQVAFAGTGDDLPTSATGRFIPFL